MKTLFITGSESFVGKELVLQCENQGIDVVGVDMVANSKPNFYQVDIRSKDIANIIPKNADAVIHLAALSRDAECKNKAYECFDINVMGTLNLINAAKKKQSKQFIFASTEWVYDCLDSNKPKDEDSFINIANHKSEYAISKLVSEANLIQKFQHGFCSTTILRFGIIYGPREANWSAVESLLSSVKNKDKVTVGSLKTARLFIHVSDVVSGIIASIGLEGFNIINIQGQKLISLGEIIEAGKGILGKDLEVTEDNPGNVSIRNISNEKARKLLNWEAKIELESGLRSLLSSI